MKAGKLDRKITIERLTSDNGFDGAGSDIWAPLVSCAAGIRQMSGREFMTDTGILSEVKRVFYIRWLEGLRLTDRVIYAGKAHNIVEIREVGRRAGLEIMTVAVG